MTVSAPRQQALVAEEVAYDSDELAYLINRIDLIWDMWSPAALVHPQLQYLYAKRECIRLLQPRLRKKIDLAEAQGTALKLSQQFANLKDMLAETQDEILRIEKKARGSRAGASGQLTTTTGSIPPGAPNAPIPPPWVDANADRYRGSPYFDSLPDPTQGSRIP